KHGAGQQSGFALEGTEESLTTGAVLHVGGNLLAAGAVHLPLEIEQQGHLIQMLGGFQIVRFAHAVPPAASAALPSSACRSSCRARSSTTPTNCRRTPKASAISS